VGAFKGSMQNKQRTSESEPKPLLQATKKM
jgi:hypothetical protein